MAIRDAPFLLIRVVMYLNKGSSLIELMIVVGIIGILSLIGLPIYNNYITKVKLTEVVTKHLYLVRQLEAELSANGFDGVYTYMQGMCSSNFIENHGRGSCKTSVGLSAGGEMIMSYGSDMVNINISSPDSSYYSGDFFMQQIIFSTGHFNPQTHRAFYYPGNLEMYPHPDSSITIPSRSYFYFDFTKNEEVTPDASRLKITKNGDTSFADIGRWYCGIAMFNAKDQRAEIIIPKSIRPSACKYLADTNALYHIVED